MSNAAPGPTGLDPAVAGRVASARPAHRPRRILFVHVADELYGSDVVLLNIVKALDPRRFAPEVILPNDLRYDGLLSSELRALGVPVRSMRLAVLRRKYGTAVGAVRFAAHLAASTAALARLIRRRRVDLVHTQTAAVFPGALAARLTRTPHVWHVSEIVTQPNAVRRLISRVVPALSDRVVAVSRAVRDHLADGSARTLAKCEVVYNGIDVDRFNPSIDGRAVRRELGIAPDRPLVGMIGRVGTWKGQELLLEAAARVARRRGEVAFVLVGGVLDGQQHQLDRLRERVRAAGLDAHVTVTDYRRDAANVHAAIDMLVQPSVRPDPLPTTVLEAMATARPVIATDHGGAREMVLDGETGYLVPPGDAEAIAERITELAADPELRRRLGERGRRRVESEFSMGAFARAYERIYDQVASRREAPDRLSVAGVPPG